MKSIVKGMACLCFYLFNVLLLAAGSKMARQGTDSDLITADSSNALVEQSYSEKVYVLLSDASHMSAQPTAAACLPRDDRIGSWVVFSLDRFFMWGPSHFRGFLGRKEAFHELEGQAQTVLSFLGLPYAAPQIIRRMIPHPSNPNLQRVTYMDGSQQDIQDLGGCRGLFHEMKHLDLRAQAYLARLHRQKDGNPFVDLSDSYKLRIAMHYRTGDIRNHGDGHMVNLDYYEQTYKKLVKALGAQNIQGCDFFAEHLTDEEKKAVKDKHLPQCKIRAQAPITDVWDSMIHADLVMIGRSEFQYTPSLFSCGIIISPEHMHLQTVQGFDTFALKPKWLEAKDIPCCGTWAPKVREQVRSCHVSGDEEFANGMKDFHFEKLAL